MPAVSRSIERMSRRPWMPCAMILVGLVVASVTLQAPARAEDPATDPVVRLTIDYGDGVEKHFTRIAWRDGMTVFDVLVEAKKHPRGIRFEHRGQGETVFVMQIDDLKNQGQGRNWTYQVNDKAGMVSCGIQRVAKDDRILWKFATRR